MDGRGTAIVVASVDGVISSAVRRRAAELLNWTGLVPVLVGIALRGWQYAANPSLWVDEAALARNILDRPVPMLFHPLDYGQVAAPGFLLAVKLSAFLFGPSEYALRLTPILAGILSVCGFFFVARLLVPRAAAIVATFMFSTAVPLVFSSSNLKPYSSDVAITLAVLALAHVVQQSVLTRGSVLWLATLGIVVLFFSQAAIFSLTAAGAAVLLSATVRSSRDRWHRVAVVLGWAAAVVGAVAYGFRSMTPVDYVYLHRFWEPAFMPTTATAAMTWSSAVARAVFAGPPRPDAFDGSLQYAWPALFVTLLVVGALMMCYMKPAQGILVVGPIVLAAVASAMGIYPVGTRVSLFLVPLLLLIVVFAADSIGRAIAGPRGGQFACLLLIPFAIIACTRQLPPKRPEHLRPVMQYVAGHWRAGDSLWVYYGAGQAFEYYNRMIGIAGDVRVGECNRGDPREYLRQVDSERGRARVVLSVNWWKRVSASSAGM
jgi:Dolichyl-phosphate-mannose-protein mannosyltransferase